MKYVHGNPNAVQSAGATQVLKGNELERAVAENADAQDYREDPLVPVVAQVVGQEPAAELANGDADLSTTGQALTSMFCIGNSAHLLASYLQSSLVVCH